MSFIIDKGIERPTTRPTRSAEMLAVKSLAVQDSIKVADKETAHRLRVYIARVYGAGAGSYRAENGAYRVWRLK